MIPAPQVPFSNRRIVLRGLLRKGAAGVCVFVGYLLSPLSWWNDLFVNIPLAALLAWPVRWVAPRWYVAAFVAAYWLTNIAGAEMLSHGLRRLVAGDAPARPPRAARRWRALLTSLFYTLVILLIWRGTGPLLASLRR